MSVIANTDLGVYNNFCKNVTEGSILYNMDITNLWGDYLLVVQKTIIRIGKMKTYSLLLLGLKKEDGQYKPRNLRISMTPDYVGRIPFLKWVGNCKFELLPMLKDIDINVGLVSVYSNTDLHKYAQKLKVRKPQKRKYDRDGKPIIKKLNN